MVDHWRHSCLGCGKSFATTGPRFRLSCDESHPPALLRSAYREHKFLPRADEPGIFRYRGWLPARRSLPGAGSPVVFPAPKLARRLGLEGLSVAFSGYWPERGALLETCSFKELEALSVCAAMAEDDVGTLVVCSAGNTGRAFLQVASLLGVPALVVVPESAVGEMWTTVALHPVVRLAVVTGGADYADAIEIGGRICEFDGFHPEGGARNTARRDGLGTVLLAAVEALGTMPRHYVQAVGSGTGGIAAWEMSRRLAAEDRFGNGPMKLHLVQNSPFAPMLEAWRAGSRALAHLDPGVSRLKVSTLHATMLGNRAPPYAITGGVFDALQDSGGDLYAVDNADALAAGRVFEETEGCDLDPAAEVALAGLMQAVARGAIGRRESVLLNLTGGGKAAVKREGKARPAMPDLRIDPTAARSSELAEVLAAGKGRTG